MLLTRRANIHVDQRHYTVFNVHTLCVEPHIAAVARNHHPLIFHRLTAYAVHARRRLGRALELFLRLLALARIHLHNTMDSRVTQIASLVLVHAQDALWALASRLCGGDSAPLTLNGRTYEILRVLGEGGFSLVFLVRDTASGTLYALKKVRAC